MPAKELAELADAPLAEPHRDRATGRCCSKRRRCSRSRISRSRSCSSPAFASIRVSTNRRAATTRAICACCAFRRRKRGKGQGISGIPNGLRARWVTWSPDGSRVAFTNVGASGVELWVVDAANAVASRVGTVVLELQPSLASICLARQRRIRGAHRRGARKAPRAPEFRRSGDQENLGRRTPGRTYQDLLTNAYDESTFEHHLQSRVASCRSTARAAHDRQQRHDHARRALPTVRICSLRRRTVRSPTS